MRPGEGNFPETLYLSYIEFPPRNESGVGYTRFIPAVCNEADFNLIWDFI